MVEVKVRGGIICHTVRKNVRLGERAQLHVGLAGRCFADSSSARTNVPRESCRDPDQCECPEVAFHLVYSQLITSHGSKTFVFDRAGETHAPAEPSLFFFFFITTL
jgi:hypothetical protein